MDPTTATAAWAYLGLSLAQILVEKGPEIYFRIVNAIQKVDPTGEDIDQMISMAKHPDKYLE
jgi:hypothetical protein